MVGAGLLLESPTWIQSRLGEFYDSPSSKPGLQITVQECRDCGCRWGLHWQREAWACESGKKPTARRVRSPWLQIPSSSAVVTGIARRFSAWIFSTDLCEVDSESHLDASQRWVRQHLVISASGPDYWQLRNLSDNGCLTAAAQAGQAAAVGVAARLEPCQAPPGRGQQIAFLTIS